MGEVAVLVHSTAFVVNVVEERRLLTSTLDGKH